jgi:hypothetical protein
MNEQNLLSIGFNVADLQTQADQVETIVTNLYKTLEGYDNAKLSPINTTGLTELVNATKAQQVQMQKLQTTVTELSLAMREYSRVADETAKINAKISVSESQLAKDNAAARVSYSEKQKLLKQEARDKDELYQKNKALKQKEAADAQFEADFEKALAEEKVANKKAAAAQEAEIQAQLTEQEKIANQSKAAADREYVRMYTSLLEEKEAAENLAAANKKKLDAEAQKNAAAQGKAALAQNDLYKQLQLKQQDLTTRFRNAQISGASKGEQAGLAAELTAVNKEIAKIDSSVERTAKGGLASMGKGLGSMLGQVRQLAYILPGIGMAGLFNLAFEAIMELVSGGDAYIKKLTEINNSQKDINSTLLEQYNIYEKLKKAEEDEANTKLGSAKIAEQALQRMTAQGLTQIDLLNQGTEIAKLSLKEVEDQVNKKGGIAQMRGDIAVDHDALITLKNDYDKATKLTDLKTHFEIFENSIGTVAQVANMTDKQLDRLATTTKNISKGQLLQLRSDAIELQAVAKDNNFKTAEVAKSHSENLKSQFENSFKLYQDNVNLISTYEQKINDNLVKIDETNKYRSDEARKQRLANAEQTYAGVKTANDLILKSELSTQEERLKAINETADAQNDLFLAQKENVTTNISASGADKAIAEGKYNEQVAKNNQDAKQEMTKTNLEFWLKNTELIHQARELDILMNQLADKTVMDNDKESYDNRLTALIEYTNDREEAVKEQYQKDLRVARQTLSADVLGLKEVQLRKEYQKQILDIENGTRQEAYNIVQSWFSKQYKLIKDNVDSGRTEAEDEATNDLLALNTQLNNKEITYKTFLTKRKLLEEQSAKDIADAKVIDDRNELIRLEDFQADLNDKLDKAKVKFSFAALFGDKKGKDAAQGDIDALTEQTKQVGKDIGDVTATMSKDQLEALEIRGKKEEEIHKQTADNWKQVEEEAFKGAQQIVDSYFENRISQIEALTEAQDKATDAELAAIERSTISAKEKNAYEVQLTAQKTARDEEAARVEKKLKHDQAVFDRDLAMSQIALNTAIGISAALKLGALGVPLAISIGALGATQLTIAAATKIPEYAMGGTHPNDGLALFGEAGTELVKEPHRKPYFVDKPTLAHLPAGTELFPLYSIPSFPERSNDSWAQTMYLGRQIAKSKREIKNIFKPNIIVDLGKAGYANRILHG